MDMFSYICHFLVDLIIKDIIFLLIITISTSLVLFFRCIINIIIAVVLGEFVWLPIVNFVVVSLYCLSSFFLLLIHSFLSSFFYPEKRSVHK